VRLRGGRAAAGAPPGFRTDLEHFHADVGWVFAGGRLEVAVGASSRDLRLGAVVDVPGEDVRAPLTVSQPLGEWFADPRAGAALQELIEQRGGIKARLVLQPDVVTYGGWSRLR